MARQNLTRNDMQAVYDKINSSKGRSIASRPVDQEWHKVCQDWLLKYERADGDFEWALSTLTSGQVRGMSSRYLQKAGRRSTSELLVGLKYFDANDSLQYCAKWLADSNNKSEDFMSLMGLDSSHHLSVLAPTVNDLKRAIVLGRCNAAVIMAWAESPNRSYEDIKHIIENRSTYKLLPQQNTAIVTGEYLQFFRMLGDWLGRSDENLSHLGEVLEAFNGNKSRSVFVDSVIDAVKPELEAETGKKHSRWAVANKVKGGDKMDVVHKVFNELQSSDSSLAGISAWKALGKFNQMMAEQDAGQERMKSVMGNIDFKRISFKGLKLFLSFYKNKTVERDDYGIDYGAVREWFKYHKAGRKELSEILPYFDDQRAIAYVVEDWFKKVGGSYDDAVFALDHIADSKIREEQTISLVKQWSGDLVRSEVFCIFAKEGRLGDIKNVEKIFEGLCQVIYHNSGVDLALVSAVAKEIYDQDENAKLDFLTRALWYKKDIMVPGNRAFFKEFIAGLGGDDVVMRAIKFMGDKAEEFGDEKMKFSQCSIFEIAKGRVVEGCEDILSRPLTEILAPEYLTKIIQEMEPRVMISDGSAKLGDLFFYCKFQQQTFADFSEMIKPEFMATIDAEKMAALQSKLNPDLVVEFTTSPRALSRGNSATQVQTLQNQVIH